MSTPEFAPARFRVTVKEDGTIDANSIEVIDPGSGFEEGEIVEIPADQVGGRDPLGSDASVEITAATLNKVTGQGSSANRIGYTAETVVDDGDYVQEVDIWISTNNYTRPLGKNLDGIIPPPLVDTDWRFESTLTCWVRGEIVLPGAALNVATAGAIPLSMGNNIVTQASEIVVADLFAPETPEEEAEGQNSGNGGFTNYP